MPELIKIMQVLKITTEDEYYAALFAAEDLEITGDTNTEIYRNIVSAIIEWENVMFLDDFRGEDNAF